MPYGKGTYGSKVGRPKKKRGKTKKPGPAITGSKRKRKVAKTVGKAITKKGKGFAKKTFITESAKSKAKRAKKLMKTAAKKRKAMKK
tara:strand:- start:205 stop:465 length:261 start_codon:yes stop_codon:yes gene_type:complete